MRGAIIGCLLIAAAGCSRLDAAHRVILVRRVRTLGQLAASLEPKASDAQADLAETAVLCSDIDDHLK